jgi:Skp family chaperone for outer membrane proteins
MICIDSGFLRTSDSLVGEVCGGVRFVLFCLMATASPLLQLLRARDDAIAPLKRFVLDYQATLNEQERLRKDLAQVEREKDALLLRLGVGDVRSSLETETKLRAYEEELHTLQSQLTAAYKKNNDNVEKLLAAHEREAEARVRKFSVHFECCLVKHTPVRYGKSAPQKH